MKLDVKIQNNHLKMIKVMLIWVAAEMQLAKCLQQDGGQKNCFDVSVLLQDGDF